MSNKRKYIIIVGDGMSDFPLDDLHGKTPLQAAHTPHMDSLAKKSIVGVTRTVPQGMKPGSDTANLSIFGYNPKKYYTGRAPLEAINMGIELAENDIAFRCNLVSINDGIMNDFTSDHIDSELTKIVIKEIKKSLNNSDIELYAGVSYRNILIWRNYPYADIPEAFPPHDITGEIISKYKPTGEAARYIWDLTEKSWAIIQDSEIIKNAFSRFKGSPTSIWLWGAGKKPAMDSFADRFNLSGYTISAVDLIHGIGKAVGLKNKFVEGATGYLDTNYEGKARAALEVLEESDFVFLHIEAPDESGHEGSITNKLRSIEDLDNKIVGPVLKGLEKFEDYTVLLMPDHATPISLKTHVDDPVPFCMFSNKDIKKPVSMITTARAYSEVEASRTGLVVEDASGLIEIMVKGSFE